MQEHPSSQALQRQLEQRTDRVRDHSPAHVNLRIDLTTQARIERLGAEGRDAIVRRLAELDQEWDIDRIVMANFAVIGGAAYAVGLARYSRKPLFGPRPKGLLYLVGTQIGFMMLHASVGWCPPVAIWRRLGYRTKSEIDVERSLLLRVVQGNGSSSVSNTRLLEDVAGADS